MEHKTKIDSITGQAHAGSGDIIVYNFGFAYQALKEALPEDAPAIQRFVESLRGFAAYHELINEWKELHNLLQELHNAIGQFYAEVDRLYNLSMTGEGKGLRRRWRPCQQKIRMLKGFSEDIKHIWSEPYHEENGRLYGPPWMIKIVGQQRDLEEMLKEDDCDIEELYNLTGEFSDDCLWHLYQADKNLRDEAGNLYLLSTRILAKLTE